MFQLLKSHHQAEKFKDLFTNSYLCELVWLVTGSQTALHGMLFKIHVKSKVIITIQVKLE
jgi:hypothetical protein